MGNYRYLLGDILTGEINAELPFTSASFSHILNAPGAFSGTMSLQQPDKVCTIVQESLNLGRSTMYVERDGVIVWGGILWTEAIDFDQLTYTVSGEGWHSYFRRQVLDEDLTYTATEQASIAKGLIDWAQARAGGDIGVETATAIATGVTRDRTYLATDRKTIGEALEQLAAVDNGFDFRYMTDRTPAGEIQVYLITSYPATGIETDLVFELGVQLTQGQATTDASNLVTHVTAVGGIIDGTDAPLLATSSDTTRLLIMPRYDEVISETDVIVSATLTDHADRRLARGAEAVCIPSISTDPAQEPVIGSWNTGDIVKVRLDVGLRSIDSDFRITEWAVTVGAAGDDVAQITFANLEVFPS